jgi:Amt family ammonium transporter
VWDGLVTFLILRGLGLFMKLRLPDEVLEVGDVAVHNEEVYPSEALTRVGSGAAAPTPAAPAEAAPAKVPSDSS